jgi:hypothetical protein
MATNLKFGEYSPPETEKEDLKIIDITLGLFFDGTLNNRRNTYIRKEEEKKEKGLAYDKQAVKDDPFGWDKDSYLNDYSNVARMAKFYLEGEDKAIYVEGIGTLDGDTDTIKGYTTGTGATGIREKVRSGCEKVDKSVPKNATINLVLDVFGFSRGAAAARAFVHEITRNGYSASKLWNSETEQYDYYDLDDKKVGQMKLPARGHLGLLFEKKKIVIKSFKIRFVGLYDTVSSYGINFNDDTTDEEDVSEINLRSIGHPSVKHVVQFAAGHEWRKNFSLTNINSAGEKGLEFTLPGCHCDIGGAYESETYEQTHFVEMEAADKDVVMRRGSASKEFLPITEKCKKGLVESGWYKPNQLKYKNVLGDYSINYKGTRFIDKRYSYIPLHYMCQLATEKEAKFKKQELNRDFKIPEKAGSSEHILNYVKSKLDLYINDVKDKDLDKRRKVSYIKSLDFANEKILINGFIHWSATNKTGHSPNKNKKRTIKDG